MKFDPRTKLFGILVTTSLAIYFREWQPLIGVLIGALLLCIVFKADYKTFYNKLKRFLWIFLFISLLQIVFIRTGEPIILIGDTVLATIDGINRGVSMGIRFIIIFSSAAIMAGENSRYVIASFSKMKIPYMFSFMMMITLRFLPIYMESFKDAITALQLRGINLKQIAVKKRVELYGHLMLPVVSDAIIKSQELAMTMEARGFGALKRRTVFLQVKLRLFDYITMLLIICAYALLFWADLNNKFGGLI